MGEIEKSSAEVLRKDQTHDQSDLPLWSRVICLQLLQGPHNLEMVITILEGN